MKSAIDYDATSLRKLFDEMSKTYGIVNLVSSFGFCRRWRKQCVELTRIEPGMQVCDLMTGMGECWPFIERQLKGLGSVIGVDFSAAMCRAAREHAGRIDAARFRVFEQDALSSGIPDESADAITAAFAMKTLSSDGVRRFAREIHRILRPGGRYAVLEFSIPPNRLLQLPFRFHVQVLVPIIGWLFLGNPDNYRQLWRYTAAFQGCRNIVEEFRTAGLTAELSQYFLGSATAISGNKPRL